MKKAISFTLISLLLQTIFATHLLANTKEEKEAGKVKVGILKLGTGPDAKVKVTLKDKTKLEGYVVSSDEQQFIVMRKNTQTEVPVSYNSVKQVKGNNLNKGVTLAIIVAVAVIRRDRSSQHEVNSLRLCLRTCSLPFWRRTWDSHGCRLLIRRTDCG